MENRNLPTFTSRNPFLRVRTPSAEGRAMFGDDWGESDESSSEGEVPVPTSMWQRAFRNQQLQPGVRSGYFAANSTHAVPFEAEGIGAGGWEERFADAIQMTKKCQIMPPAEKEMDEEASCSSTSYKSPFYKDVTVEVTGEPANSGVRFVKKAPTVQPWMVGNVYSWPVGALFDHIEGASEEEWMDEGCSSDEDLDSEAEQDGKRKKKAVNEILFEMGFGLPKVCRIKRQPPLPPRGVAPISSSDETDSVDINEVIKLRIEDIVMQAVMKYVT